MNTHRIFVEKKAGLDNEAKGLLNEAKNLLGIETLEDIRLFNRYDAENITEELFSYAVKTVFSAFVQFIKTLFAALKQFFSGLFA